MRQRRGIIRLRMSVIKQRANAIVQRVNVMHTWDNNLSNPSIF
jgi:hypothetical protein